MAYGLAARKSASATQEPQFGLTGAFSGLRLGPQDRVQKPMTRQGDEASDKRQGREKTRTSADEQPESRGKPRSRTGRNRRRKSKVAPDLSLGRMVYWGAVLGLWPVIAVVGIIVWVGAHLPPIQSLEIPKRPPTIQIVGLDGNMLATRGEMAGADIALKELPPYLPKAFIAIEDRRFYSHFGVDPIGIARAAFANLLHRAVSRADRR